MSEKRKLGDIGLDPQEDQGPSRRTPAPTVNPPAADEVVGPAAVPEYLWVKYGESRS
ncbi:hypothetical protein MP638_004041, partial [Amoeboaphelidium occidentale]